MIEYFMDWFFEKALPVILAFLIIAVVLFVGIGSAAIGRHWWMTRNDPPPTTIVLVKSEWACTSLQRHSTTYYVKSGNVMVPITSNTNVCHQWSKQP